MGIDPRSAFARIGNLLTLSSAYSQTITNMPSNTAAKFHARSGPPATKSTEVGSAKRNIQRKHSFENKSSKKQGGGGKGAWHDKVPGVDKID